VDAGSPFEQEVAALLHEVRAMKLEITGSEVDRVNGKRILESINRIHTTTKRQRQVLEQSLPTYCGDAREQIARKIHVCLMIEHECLLLPETWH
jgi:hypothetical protein